MTANDLVIFLSRFQFAFTAIFHFIFVPLTLGLSWILVVMEAIYLKTGNIIYKDMTKFWGKLLVINFAVGAVTGITLEFEFGLNWSYFSRMIGDTFGATLAIEGITAFMTETTMLGLYIFTWDKVNKKIHFIITTLLAIGSNLSIVNILVANSWMQNPVGSYLDWHTLTMNITSFTDIYFQELAQVRIGHVIFSSILTSSCFVLGISAYYLIKKINIHFAIRSLAIATVMGLSSSLFTLILGDASGLEIAQHEPEKMAAIEGEWTTPKAPAAWILSAFPSQKNEKNYGPIIRIPYALSIIATHSLDGTIQGLHEVMDSKLININNGIKAYSALINLRTGVGSIEDEKIFNTYSSNIGYAYLLHNPRHVTQDDILQATKQSIPYIFTTFWAFRIMVFSWGAITLILLISLYFLYKQKIHTKFWFLRICLYSIFLPWLASTSGWILTEFGRQPWIIKNILPTYVGISSLNWSNVAFSLITFIILYISLFSLEIYMMIISIIQGPTYTLKKKIKE
jgi:cytochrome d ubiquinol oxidase subunit I